MGKVCCVTGDVTGAFTFCFFAASRFALGVLGMFFLLLLLVGRVLIRVTPMLFRGLYWGLWVQYMLYMMPLSMVATALHLLISTLSFIGNFDHEPHVRYHVCNRCCCPEGRHGMSKAHSKSRSLMPATANYLTIRASISFTIGTFVFYSVFTDSVHHCFTLDPCSRGDLDVCRR